MPADIEPAASPAATTAVVDPAATAPAPAVDASAPPARKPGFLARLVGGSDEVAGLRAELEAEKTAHAATAGKLREAEGRLSAFDELEAKAEARFEALTAERDGLKQQLAAAQADLAAAQTAAATVPQQVATGVRDAVAGLGVEEAALPAAQAAPDKPGTAGEFAHLKGRDRAAAAFSAQFATK